MLAEGLLIAVGYVLCFGVGIAFVLQTGISVVWPPSGFALAVLLRFGPRSIIPIWIGDVVSGIYLSDSSPASAAMMATLAIIEPMIGVLLLRLVGFDSSLRRLRDIAALVAIGA